MRVSVMLTALMVLSLVVTSNSSTIVVASFIPPTAPAFAGTSPAAVQFSSGYTTLTKCGSGMTKKEEKEAEQQGSDIPTHCKGYGGYAIDISYSACASMLRVEKGEDNIMLAMQPVNWKQKTVEWRLADGKPFAVIMRVYEYSGTDLCATDGKIIGESLVVKGLKGYEQIDEEVKVKGTPNPNVRARELADKGYAKSRQ